MDKNEEKLVESWLIGKSYFQVLDKILDELDCTRVTSIGRPMQTINYRYSFLMEAFNIIINKAIDSNFVTIEQCNLYRGKLEQRHIANLEFEKDNPPIIYSKKKGGKSAPPTGGKKLATSIKSKDLITGEEVIEAIKAIKPTLKKKREARPKAVRILTKDNVIIKI